VARWLLEDFADPRLRRSERIDLIAGVLGNGGTADYGFAWLKQNIGDLLGGSSGIFLANRLPRMLAGFCSSDKADAIEALLRPRLQGKTGALALERTIEQVRSCATLRQARGAEFTAALAKAR
ncbi:MAG: M1 family peptidase, partial [Novosphingobium sp.]|nr:M1 family peptidase [Novosphingobium sp.]